MPDTDTTPESSAPTSASDREGMFVLFSFIWGVSELIHQAVFYYLWLRFGLGYVPGWGLTVAALLLIIKPSSPIRLAFVSVMDVFWQFQQMPNIPNHIFFNMLVNLTIALALCGPIFRFVKGKIFDRADAIAFDRATLLDRFTGPVRVELILLYLFAALAKLNVDFMNPEVSCGAVMFRETIARVGLSVDTDFLPLVSIWVTIVVEWLVPLLLVVPKSRVAAIAIGSVFHLLLSLHPVAAIYSFSAMSMALYVLFLPLSFATLLNRLWSRCRASWLKFYSDSLRVRLPIVVVTLAILAVGMAVTTYLGWTGLQNFADVNVRFGNVDHFLKQVRFAMWLIWGLTMLTGFCVITLASRGTLTREKIADGGSRCVAAWFLPPVVVFTGLNPYLGLRTETAFAMFSNLRTEGGRTNHLFMPVQWHVSGWQEDLVFILDSSNPGFRVFRDEELLLPYFLFRGRTSEIRDQFWIQYKRNGDEYYFDSRKQPDHELLRRPPWVLRKWLAFRPIDREGPMQCRH